MHNRIRTLALVAASLTLAGSVVFAAPALADETAAPAAPTQEAPSSPATSEIVPTSTVTPPSIPEASAPTPSSEAATPAAESSAVSTPPTEPTKESSSESSAKAEPSPETSLPTKPDPSSTTSVAPTSPGKGHTPVVLCHKPGTPAQQTLTVDDNAVKGHLGHGDTLGECAPLSVPVEGWWIMPNGGTAEHVTWPQAATPVGVVPCGTTAQVDTYPSAEALAKLAADGVLTLGEDYGIAISWRFVYGGDCPVVTPPPVVVPPTDTPTPPAVVIPPTEAPTPTPTIAETPVTERIATVSDNGPRVLAQTGSSDEWMIGAGAIGILLAISGLMLALTTRRRTAKR